MAIRCARGANQWDLEQKSKECSLIMHAYEGDWPITHRKICLAILKMVPLCGWKKVVLSPYAEVFHRFIMSDPGNETTLGHRRWILSNVLGPIGLGSTSRFSCMYVIGGSGSGNSLDGLVPPGVVALWTHGFGVGKGIRRNGRLGHSQSDSINLSNAAVTITLDDGTDLPVTVTEIGRFGMCSRVHSAWFPMDGFLSQVEPMMYILKPLVAWLITALNW